MALNLKYNIHNKEQTVKSLLFGTLLIISLSSFADTPAEQIRKLAGTYVGQTAGTFYGRSHDSYDSSEVCYVEISQEKHLIGIGEGSGPMVLENGKSDYDYTTYFEVLEKPDFQTSKQKIVIKYLKPGYMYTPLKTTLELNRNGELESTTLEYKIHFLFEQYASCTKLVKQNL
jgi:hypothetical protein